jgi:hypothetical protein
MTEAKKKIEVAEKRALDRQAKVDADAAQDKDKDKGTGRSKKAPLPITASLHEDAPAVLTKMLEFPETNKLTLVKPTEYATIGDLPGGRPFLASTGRSKGLKCALDIMAGVMEEGGDDIDHNEAREHMAAVLSFLDSFKLTAERPDGPPRAGAFFPVAPSTNRLRQVMAEFVPDISQDTLAAINETATEQSVTREVSSSLERPSAFNQQERYHHVNFEINAAATVKFVYKGSLLLAVAHPHEVTYSFKKSSGRDFRDAQELKAYFADLSQPLTTLSVGVLLPGQVVYIPPGMIIAEATVNGGVVGIKYQAPVIGSRSAWIMASRYIQVTPVTKVFQAMCGPKLLVVLQQRWLLVFFIPGRGTRNHVNCRLFISTTSSAEHDNDDDYLSYLSAMRMR